MFLFGWDFCPLSAIGWRAIIESLPKEVTKKDLQSALNKLVRDHQATLKEVKGLKIALGKLKEDNRDNVQKMGLVRFNPFSETGGDQSFCLAILDDRDSGLVISSLHSRDTTRIYAKPINEGKSDWLPAIR